jgi:ubiquinone/menaquinone biosynthesis C-methylase UbiE
VTGIDFDAWARTYDDTRGASPSVLRPVLRALGAPDGRSLLDVGGGTGNFASALLDIGFAVTLTDVAPAMTRRARGKLAAPAPCIAADAQRLPFASASFDCAISINVMRHVPDRIAALREARRVLRDGPLVVKVSTAETIAADWVHAYFPALLDHQPPYFSDDDLAGELRTAGFSRVDLDRVVYEDDADGSFQAFKRFPEHLLDEERVRNTAVKRLPDAELRSGIARLRADMASGAVNDVIERHRALMERYGDGTILIAHT